MKNDSSTLVVIPSGKEEDLEKVGSKFQTTYYEFVCEVPYVISLPEISEEELMELAHKHGEFAYIESPEEDIYSLSDGTPL